MQRGLKSSPGLRVRSQSELFFSFFFLRGNRTPTSSPSNPTTLDQNTPISRKASSPPSRSLFPQVCSLGTTPPFCWKCIDFWTPPQQKRTSVSWPGPCCPGWGKVRELGSEQTKSATGGHFLRPKPGFGASPSPPPGAFHGAQVKCATAMTTLPSPREGDGSWPGWLLSPKCPEGSRGADVILDSNPPSPLPRPCLRPMLGRPSTLAL